MSHAGVTQEFETRREMIAHAESLGLKPGEYVVETRKEVEPVENALYNVRSIVRTAAEALQADPQNDVVMYLSGPTNFRNGIATIKPYKGNRDKAHKPEHAAAIKAMIRKEYNVVTSEDEEADDVMAYEHYASWLRDPYESVIATIDKDLDMIPGLHYNFVTGNSYEITPEHGIYNFYKQCLTGDTTDNIPGIDGVGPVRAAKILEGAEGSGELHLFGAVRKAYEDVFGEGWAARLLEVGRLLWIRRQPDEWWNFPEGEQVSA
jgi:DNA polymerase-1